MTARAGARLGKVSRINAAGDVYVELADVAPGFEFGPVIDTVGGLTVGDRVIAQPLARDDDELVVTGIVGGRPVATVVEAALDAAYPVGSLYLSVNATDPAALFGGTWASLGAGRTLVGVDPTDPDFADAEQTGGAKEVTLTADQSGLPAHGHGINDPTHEHGFMATLDTATGAGGLRDIIVGGGGTWNTDDTNAINHAATGVTVQNATPQDAVEAHDNMPPYVTVHMWKRTA